MFQAKYIFQTELGAGAGSVGGKTITEALAELAKALEFEAHRGSIKATIILKP